MINRLIKWLRPVKEQAMVTVVRRYITANGFIGEIYIDGKQVGVSCDNLTQIRGPLAHNWPWRSVGNPESLLKYGDFKLKTPLGQCYIAAIDGSDIMDLVLQTIKKYDARLLVLARLWQESQ